MELNQVAANEQDDNVVPLSDPKARNNGWVFDNLRNLFQHFTQEKAKTDERFAVIAREKAKTDARLGALVSRTRKLATSTDLLIRETNTLTSSGEHLSEKLQAVSASLESSMRVLGKRSGNTDSKLDSLRKQVEHIEAATRALDSRTSDLARRTLDLEETDKRLAEETESLKTRVATLESRQKVLEESSRILFRDTEMLADRTGQLSNRFRRAAWGSSGAVLMLALAIGTTAWFNASRTDGVSADTGEQLSEVRSELTASIERLETTGVETRKIEQQIGDLQTQIDARTAGTIELQLETSELTDEIQDVNRRLATMSEQIQGELGVIKDRIYAPDDSPQMAAADMSTLRGNSWLKAQNPNHYVIQLVSVYREQELAEFIGRFRGYLPMDRLSYSKTLHRGRDMYVLLLGSFAKFDDAIQKLETLPAALQNNRPYIRALRGVQRRMT